MVFEELKELRFQAVTYMPTRNSIGQLRKVKKLCDKFGFFQICGEDINSPRQSFICEILKHPEFEHLIDATWALIGHELEATKDISRGFFSAETIKKYPDLYQRIDAFKEIGKKSGMHT